MSFFKRFISKKRESQNTPLREAKRQGLFLKIREILAKELKIADIEKIQLTSKLQEDLGVESLHSIELIMAFEEAFNIEIPDEDAEKILTVKEIIDYLEKKVSQKKPK